MMALHRFSLKQGSEAFGLPVRAGSSSKVSVLVGQEGYTLHSVDHGQAYGHEPAVNNLIDINQKPQGPVSRQACARDPKANKFTNVNQQA